MIVPEVIGMGQARSNPERSGGFVNGEEEAPASEKRGMGVAGGKGRRLSPLPVWSNNSKAWSCQCRLGHVVLEKTAEAFPTSNFPPRPTQRSNWRRKEQQVVLALVIALLMIMQFVFPQRPPQ